MAAASLMTGAAGGSDGGGGAGAGVSVFGLEPMHMGSAFLIVNDLLEVRDYLRMANLTVILAEGVVRADMHLIDVEEVVHQGRVHIRRKPKGVNLGRGLVGSYNSPLDPLGRIAEGVPLQTGFTQGGTSPSGYSSPTTAHRRSE